MAKGNNFISNEQKRANARQRNAAILAAGLGITALFGAAGCKQPTDPIPNIKPVNPEYALDYGFILEDQTGGLITQNHIDMFNAALQKFDTDGTINMSALSGIKINVIQGDAHTSTGNIITFGFDYCFNVNWIDAYLGELLYNMAPLPMGFNFNIHLANGKAQKDAFSAKELAAFENHSKNVKGIISRSRQNTQTLPTLFLIMG
jgi:hypothetical protein